MSDGPRASARAIQRYDAETAECLLFTGKAGLLASAAHDLKLLVTRFEVDLDELAGGIGATGRFDAASIRVGCARRDGRDAPGVLAAKDRAEIERTVAREVLQAHRFPFIEFKSTSIARHPPGGYRIEGVLTLRGREGPLAMLARQQGAVALIDGSIDQPAFGIVPFSAMLGALKVKAEIGFRLVLPWPAQAAVRAANP